MLLSLCLQVFHASLFFFPRRRRAACLTRSSARWRRHVLWIFGFNSLLDLSPIGNILPAMLKFWLRNFRLNGWRLRRGCRCGYLGRGANQELVALHLRECPGFNGGG
jgi:hypothetical protein